MSAFVKTPRWFWFVGALIFAWSLMGVAAFAMQYGMGPAELAALPPEQRDAFMNMPSWAWAAYGVGTIGSAIASVLLLLRRTLALPVFMISWVAVIVQFGWTFLGYHLLDKMPASAAIFPAFIIVVGAIEIWFTKLAIKRGWLA